MSYKLTDIPATQAQGPLCQWAFEARHPACVDMEGGEVHVGVPSLAECPVFQPQG